MPIYEYLCGKCETEFEVEQRISDEPVKTCPRCRSRKVKRLISQTSFVLKGGGWYSDLYSSSSKKEGKGEAKPEGGAAKESKSSDSTPSDSGKTKEKAKGGKGARAAA
jgi:putative FmdB family regulatory protein